MSALDSLVIATRGSQLALWQANFVTSLLAGRGETATKLVLTTTGDRVQDRFLHEIGGKGLFTKELEQALFDERADLAVHSLKDMPARLLEPFTLTSVLPRHSPRDLFILSPKLAAQAKLPEGALSANDMQGFGAITVGTGSLRRTALLKKYAPELKCIGVRGNVDTRLKKLASGEWDALILAEASLVRLNITDVVARPIAPEWFIPCAAQGALAIEMRKDHSRQRIVAALDDPETHQLVTIERELLARLGGDCTMPFGCLAVVKRDKATPEVHIRAIILSPSGDSAAAELVQPLKGENAFQIDAPSLVQAVYERLVSAGAPRILTALGLSGKPK